MSSSQRPSTRCSIHASAARGSPSARRSSATRADQADRPARRSRGRPPRGPGRGVAVPRRGPRSGRRAAVATNRVATPGTPTHRIGEGLPQQVPRLLEPAEGEQVVRDHRRQEVAPVHAAEPLDLVEREPAGLGGLGESQLVLRGALISQMRAVHDPTRVADGPGRAGGLPGHGAGPFVAAPVLHGRPGEQRRGRGARRSRCAGPPPGPRRRSGGRRRGRRPTCTRPRDRRGRRRAPRCPGSRRSAGRRRTAPGRARRRAPSAPSHLAPLAQQPAVQQRVRRCVDEVPGLLQQALGRRRSGSPAGPPRPPRLSRSTRVAGSLVGRWRPAARGRRPARGAAPARPGRAPRRPTTPPPASTRRPGRGSPSARSGRRGRRRQLDGRAASTSAKCRVHRGRLLGAGYLRRAPRPSSGCRNQ